MIDARTVTQYRVSCDDCGCYPPGSDWRDYTYEAAADAEAQLWNHYPHSKKWRCPKCAGAFEEVMSLLYEV